MLSHVEREELTGALETLSRYTRKATGKPLPFQVSDYGMVSLDFQSVRVSIGGSAGQAPSGVSSVWMTGLCRFFAGVSMDPFGAGPLGT
jgi:hypothetical protein